jgi:hypothetical protein
VFLGSITGVSKGLDFTDSEKPNVEMLGTLITVASAMFMGASFGVIVFAIKLFVFICMGRTV